MSTHQSPTATRGPNALVPNVVFNVIDIGIVILRFYDRIHLRGGLWWDDWTIFLACIVTTFCTACQCVMVANGWGHHTEFLTLEQLSISLEWVTWAELTSYLTVGLLKVSVCLFVLRILGRTHRWTRICLYVLIVLVIIITALAIIFLCISCIPIQGIWTLDPRFEKKCLSPQVQTSVTKAFGIIGIITDLACILIPIWVIRRLQMGVRQKWIVCLIIALGFVTVAFSIGKTITGVFGTDDPSWGYEPVLIFAGLEGNLGIFVASMPALRQLFARVLHPSTHRETATEPNETYILRGTSRINKTHKREKLGTYNELSESREEVLKAPMSAYFPGADSRY